MIITNHAYDRFKERLGLNKKAANRMAEKAYKLGIRHNETSGQLFKYISKICYKSMVKGSEIVLYGDVVYCFKYDDYEIKLCTVYKIPNNLLNRTHGLQRRKNNNGIKNQEDER